MVYKMIRISSNCVKLIFEIVHLLVFSTSIDEVGSFRIRTFRPLGSVAKEGSHDLNPKRINQLHLWTLKK